MGTVSEQFAAAAKAHFDAQLLLVSSLTSKAFEGVERVIELNADTVRSTLGQASNAARSLATGSTAPELFSKAKAVQADAAGMRDYGARMAGIAADMQAEFARSAEQQVAQTRERLVALVEEAGRNAPAGSEPAIAAMRAVLKSADMAYAQLISNTRQAVDAMQTSIRSACSASSGQPADMAEKVRKPPAKS